MSAGRIMVAFGNSSKTACSPKRLLRKNLLPPDIIWLSGSGSTFKAETCIKRSTPISRQIRAIRLAPSTCTSLNLKFFVSYSRPTRFITTLEYLQAVRKVEL
uniref:Uncharacterized protein n=1 Tax=Glossina austeni TaxID=7395 RepID=A0A1A9URA1_GLOAU